MINSFANSKVVVPIFEVLKPGLLTTIQDLGRKGYQKYGLAVSGAADSYAHRIANLLVGNSVQEATIETTLVGLQLKARNNMIIAITGGNLQPEVNNQPAPMWTSFPIQAGDILKFNGSLSGCRAYVAVAGGINAEMVMGSRATDIIGSIGGIEGRALRKGDIIKTFPRSSNCPIRRRLLPSLIPEYPNHIKVRVVLGPQDDAFTTRGINTFLSSEYTVSIASDRMACRLEGPVIEHRKSADIVSEGMFHGAIQVPQNGQPILFQVGRQSVGGYTKIAGVITADFPKVAQLRPKDRITFECVTLTEAHAILREQERLFQLLKASNTKKEVYHAKKTD